MTDAPPPSGDDDLHRRELTRERAVNEQYIGFLDDLVTRQPHLVIVAPANNIWTGAARVQPVSRCIVQPMIGRVELDVDDELLGRGFYIGTWRHETSGRQFVSWVAPKAQLFFDFGDDSGQLDDDLADHVIGIRTFEHRLDDITDFVDDRRDGAPGGLVGHDASSLRVPEAPSVERPRPSGASRPSTGPDPTPEQRPAATEPTEVDGEPASDRSESPQDAQDPQSGDGTAGNGRSEPAAVDGPPLRAAASVRRAIERPREGRLRSVLATLQPDQYRLVSSPPDQLLVVQGQPGTGKTIIATHRAAFLTLPRDAAGSQVAGGGRRPERRSARVLIVGPTDQYSDHVGGVIRDLTPGNVVVRSLPEILRRLAGIERGTRLTPEKDQWRDTDPRLARLIDRVARDLRSGTVPGSTTPTALARAIVDQLVRDTDVHRRYVTESAVYSELGEWLRALRSHDHARTSGHALPFLAWAGIAGGRIRSEDRFPHIIVDEAQDVRPLEWRVLTALLEPGGNWTLVGDMNQRRSDWSPRSWSELVEDQEMIPDIADLNVAVLETGYRSTKQILRFANRLLPKSERSVHALVEGPEPVVRRVRADQLIAAAVDESIDLARTHAAGTVAVITLQPRAVADALRVSGRSRGQLRYSWESDGSAPIIPLHPTQARGLEFDAVVVVEPSGFPPNLGRHGLLYTSLTRATKQLVVLHSSGLPKEMRAPRS